MTTTDSRLVSPLEMGRRRIINFWRMLFAPGDLTALFVSIAVLLIPAFALADTGWNLALRTLVPVSVLSVLFGFLLARSQYNEFFALIVGSLYGFAFVMLITTRRLHHRDRRGHRAVRAVDHRCLYRRHQSG
jgi:hypothetical protein